MSSGKKIIAGLNEAIEHAKANTEQRNDAVRLKPCPFCGGEATLEKLENGQRSVGCIEASGQPCIGFQMLSSYPTDAEAIAAWNCRYPRSDDERSTMERLADILRDSSYKPTQRFLGAAFLGYDYARRLYSGQIALPDAQPPAPSLLEGEVLGFAHALENGDFDNVAFALNQRMCCDGHMCGCQGSTVGQYLAYELREIIKKPLTAKPIDWLKVAKLAGEHGIRYRTNRALEQFLTALSTEAGSGEVRITKEWCLNMAALEDGEIGAGMPDHPLRAAIAEAGKPAPSEPVAWMYTKPGHFNNIRYAHERGLQLDGSWTETPLYAAPVEPAPSEERLREAASIIEQFLEYLGDDPWRMVGKARDFLAGISSPLSHDAEGESATVSREGEAARVPADVCRLVVAARIVSEEFAGVHGPENVALSELSDAVEAFASRVCWNDDGGSIPEAHANPCTCGLSDSSPATSTERGR